MVCADVESELLGIASVSEMSGYSRQQIRDLEAAGAIAPALRATNGYRRFAQHHVRDLRAYRGLAVALGPVRARRAMREVRTLPPDQAAAMVSSFHAALVHERDDVLAAQQALRMIRAEAASETRAKAADSMTITQLADALGVRTSALRFWEKAGLIHPERVTTPAGTARRYPLPAIHEARITVALRAAGYRIPDIRDTMTAIHRMHEIDDPLAALQSRVQAITDRILALLRAGTELATIIDQDDENPLATTTTQRSGTAGTPR